ncbi:MAG: outer membrane lipoprotein-sorting protein [Bacteroidales bacterium]|jgi:outer membrane lipoprotein-sorting protein|nr:outer membrane lipoprotein-sorting protein [Bacteroidales bacterium]
MKTGKFILLCSLVAASVATRAQTPDAAEIVKRADENRQGKSLYSEVVMTVVRPTWTREVGIKNWSKGNDYSLILITSPAKDKGQAFLKRGKDLWNWIPGIGRMIKMSSSVMGQSWMGSDFTNDDMVKQSSIVNDYTHRLDKTETVREFDCYKVTLTPKENAAVVWGKVIMWISKADFIEIKTEFFDEDDILIHTYNGYDIRQYGTRKLASRMEIIPADKPTQKTVMTINKYDFDIPLEDSFFSQQNMKKAK